MFVFCLNKKIKCNCICYHLKDPMNYQSAFYLVLSSVNKQLQLNAGQYTFVFSFCFLSVAAALLHQIVLKQYTLANAFAIAFVPFSSLLTLSTAQIPHYHPVVISLLWQPTQLDSKDYHRGNHHNDLVNVWTNWVVVFQCANNLKQK